MKVSSLFWKVSNLMWKWCMMEMSLKVATCDGLNLCCDAVFLQLYPYSGVFFKSLKQILREIRRVFSVDDPSWRQDLWETPTGFDACMIDGAVSETRSTFVWWIPGDELIQSIIIQFPSTKCEISSAIQQLREFLLKNLLAGKPVLTHFQLLEAGATLSFLSSEGN